MRCGSSLLQWLQWGMIGLLMGIDVLRRAGSSAQLVGAVNVTAINLGIILGALAGGFLIDHINLRYIGLLEDALFWGG